MVQALPDEARAAVADAFPGGTLQDATLLAGGRSGALVFALRVSDRAYVLRQSDAFRASSASPERAARELACMRIAAERGVAPALHHVDPTRGIAIMDRVDGVTFGRGPSRDATIDRVGRALRRLHDGPLFPDGDPLEVMFAKVDGALRAKGGAGLPASLLALVAELAPVAARGARRVACHNDLNPTNILEPVDDRDRVFFVDWESAAAGDPFFDLGTLGVFTCRTEADRARVLEVYLGRSPDEEERARSALGRVLGLTYYAGIFCFVGAMRGLPTELAAPKTMTELLGSMDTSPPNVAAASLLAEAQRERARESVAEALRVLGT